MTSENPIPMKASLPERDPSITNIMIVDDSAVVRGMITRHLSQVSRYKVAASLVNGKMAVDYLKKHDDIDIIILDIEMPIMDGMTALPQLLEIKPDVNIIMASTLTLKNADISIEALKIGAKDYVPKPSSRDDKEALNKFYEELIDKIDGLVLAPKLAASDVVPKYKPVAPVNPGEKSQSNLYRPEPAPIVLKNIPTYPTLKPQALAIASSTGGPQALITLFKSLKGGLSDVPVFITQHMPKTFTKILAEHITEAADRECKEAEDGDIVEPGMMYLAPGDYHMVPHNKGNEVVIHLNQETEVNYCRPSADPMVEGLISIYGKNLLFLVLTGMGHDGFHAAKKLHGLGGTIIAQDKETSVVWGMPKAVAEHDLCRAVLPLNEIPNYLRTAYGELA